MGKALNWIITGIAVLFFIPTTLILISWNALPGDSLYSVKTGLEDTALAVLSGTSLAPDLSVKYTERRFDEAGKLLAKKGSTAGYSLLLVEARRSQAIIVNEGDIQSGAELIVKINEYQAEIEQKRTAIESGVETVPVTPSVPGTTRTVPTVPPKPVIVTDSEAEVIVIEPAASEEEVVEDLEEVVEELEEIEEEIERQLPEQAAEQASQVHEEKEEGGGKGKQNSKHKDDEDGERDEDD